METVQEDNVIPAEDFRKAIETCCLLPRLNRYYANAPQSARLFIALQFYARVFSSTRDEVKYRSCLAEIEPDLGMEDVDYLLEGETDLGTVSYLENLRARLVAGSAQDESSGLKGRGVPAPQMCRGATAPTVPPPMQATPSAPLSSMLTPTRRLKPAGHLKRVADVRREQSLDVQELPARQQGVSEYEQQIISEYELQQLDAKRQLLRERLLTIFVGALVVGVCFVGWHFFGDDLMVLVSPSENRNNVVAQPNVEPLQPVDGQNVIARAEAEAKERIERAEAAAKERIAREAAEQMERLEQDEKRRMEAAERKRREEEARKAADREQTKRTRYDDVVLAFKEAEYGFWNDAPKEVRPSNVKTVTTFCCLLPSEGGRFDIFELKVSPGGKMEIMCLRDDREPEPVATDDFTKRAGASPHLLLHGRQAYFSGAPEKESAAKRVPGPGGGFNPFQIEFGPLYEIARGLGITNPSMAYDVAFRPKGEDAEVPIATVFFGKDVSYTTFRNKVSEWMARRTAQRRSKTIQVKKRTLVLSNGQTVHRRLDGVTEVPRTFVYSSSNKHRYWYSSRAYESEVRKEEIARAKWQRLYDEAVRQEQAEEEILRNLEVGSCVPSDAELEGVLRSGTVVFQEKKQGGSL